MNRHHRRTWILLRALCALAAIAALSGVAVGAATAKSHKTHRTHKKSGDVHCGLTNLFGELVGANIYGQGGTPTYSLTVTCSGKHSRAVQINNFTVLSNKQVQGPNSGRSAPGTPCTITGPFSYSCTLSNTSARQTADTADTIFTSPDGCQQNAWSGTVVVPSVSEGRGRHKTFQLPFTATLCEIVGLPGPSADRR